MTVQLESVIALIQLLVILAMSGFLLWYTKDTYRTLRKEEAERILRLFDD
jgi:cbb3-type cytochrome oxidase subunit 3